MKQNSKYQSQRTKNQTKQTAWKNNFFTKKKVWLKFTKTMLQFDRNEFKMKKKENSKNSLICLEVLFKLE